MFVVLGSPHRLVVVLGSLRLGIHARYTPGKIHLGACQFCKTAEPCLEPSYERESAAPSTGAQLLRDEPQAHFSVDAVVQGERDLRVDAIVDEVSRRRLKEARKVAAAALETIFVQHDDRNARREHTADEGGQLEPIVAHPRLVVQVEHETRRGTSCGAQTTRAPVAAESRALALECADTLNVLVELGAHRDLPHLKRLLESAHELARRLGRAGVPTAHEQVEILGKAQIGERFLAWHVELDLGELGFIFEQIDRLGGGVDESDGRIAHLAEKAAGHAEGAGA